uniref:Uncharacterized protein n=1 Tax=Compsopogon caeruleus TaxID=31354 RepID=A0A7S1TIM3_9RHOD
MVMLLEHEWGRVDQKCSVEFLRFLERRTGRVGGERRRSVELLWGYEEGGKHRKEMELREWEPTGYRTEKYEEQTDRELAPLGCKDSVGGDSPDPIEDGFRGRREMGHLEAPQGKTMGVSRSSSSARVDGISAREETSPALSRIKNRVTTEYSTAERLVKVRAKSQKQRDRARKHLEFLVENIRIQTVRIEELVETNYKLKALINAGGKTDLLDVNRPPSFIISSNPAGPNLASASHRVALHALTHRP